jgi:quercetin dioxygenase-like cupin family protein
LRRWIKARPEPVSPRQSNTQEKVMSEVILRTVDDREWTPAGIQGLDYTALRPHENGGATIMLRFAKGARGANHRHPGGEEAFVISGDITIGGKRMKAGDFLYTPPDASHDAIAHEETILLLNLPQLPVFE